MAEPPQQQRSRIAPIITAQNLRALRERLRPSQSIRVAILLLVLVAVLPLLAIIGFNIYAKFADEREEAETRALTVVRLLSARVDDHLVEVQSLLLALSKMVSSNPADLASNDALLASIRAELPDYYSNLNVSDLQGRNIGSSERSAEARQRLFVGDRLYFLKARDERQLAIGEPAISRTRNVWTIGFARPVLDDRGNVVAVVSAATQLDRLTTLLDPGALPPDSVITVLNEAGTVIVRTLAPELWIGQNISAVASVADALRRRYGVDLLPSADGIRRLSAWQMANRVPWLIYVGIPVDEALESAYVALWRGLGIGLVTLAASLLLAVFLSRRIVAPIRQVAADATAFGGGDLGRRSAIGTGGEIGALAAAFNRMADAIGDRELRHRLVSRATNDVIWDASPTGNRLTWSDSLERVFGYTPDQVGPSAEWWRERLHPDDRTRVVSALRQALKSGGEAWANEYRFRRADGSYAPIVDRGFIARDAAGRTTRVIGSMIDVTDRYAREEALRETADFKAAILASALDPIVTVDRDGRILEFSAAAERTFGFSRSEVLFHDMAELIMPARYREQHRQGMARYLATGKSTILGQRLELAALRKDGSEFPIELAIATIDLHGRLAFTATMRDLSERKATEEQLAQAQKMEAVGHLTGGVAHDFNNLLAVILGNLELIEERIPANSPLHNLVATAMRSTHRGAELTQRLLAFARRQPLSPQPVSLNRLVSNMTQLLQRTLGETIEVATVLAAGVWTARVDPVQVESALLNLAVNARDAMPKGGKLTIEVANTVLDEDYANAQKDVRPGRYIMIAVTDTGVGMPHAVLERAFEPFFTTKGVGRGSGLGLSMVYGFVKQSGGNIKIYSEVGHGTTVRMYFPKTDAPADTAAIAADEPQEPPARPTVILVVEDDPDVRTIADQMLSSLGYRVLQAVDGPSALAVLDSTPEIELVLTDVVLPRGMRGTDIAREAKLRRPDIKILYMSGYTENAIIHQGAVDEGVELLSKPFRKAELSRKLRKILEG